MGRSPVAMGFFGRNEAGRPLRPLGDPTTVSVRRPGREVAVFGSCDRARAIEVVFLAACL